MTYVCLHFLWVEWHSYALAYPLFRPFVLFFSSGKASILPCSTYFVFCPSLPWLQSVLPTFSRTFCLQPFTLVSSVLVYWLRPITEWSISVYLLILYAFLFIIFPLTISRFTPYVHLKLRFLPYFFVWTISTLYLWALLLNYLLHLPYWSPFISPISSVITFLPIAPSVVPLLVDFLF